MKGVQARIVMYFTVSFFMLYVTFGFQFDPQQVFFSETPLLTLYVTDFNTSEINVTICDVACHNVTKNKRNITCSLSRRQFVGAYTENCNVTKNERNENKVTANQTLKFVWPEFKTFKPTSGPVSGNTTVTFTGNNLNINSSIVITVANVTCKNINYENGKVLKCHTGQPVNNKPYCGIVEISVNNIRQNFTNNTFNTFCYKEAPVITSVSPNKTIQSGGTTLTLLGENLDNDEDFEVQLFIKNESRKMNCTKDKSPNRTTCQTPNVLTITTSHFTSNNFVCAKLVMKWYENTIPFNSSDDIRVYRDPSFKNLSSQECHISKETHSIWGLYFSQFISHEIKVSTASGKMCQITYRNESFLECNTHVNKSYNQSQYAIGSTPPEILATQGNQRNSYISSKSGPTVSTTTQPLASTSKLETVCPLTIEIGNLRSKLFKVTEKKEIPQCELIKCGIVIPVIAVLVILVLALTVRLKKMNSMKKRQKYLYFTQANSGSGRPSSQNLKQILDAVVPDGQDRNHLIFTLDLLTVGRCIGSGNFGCVYEGLLKLEAGFPPLKVALKTLQDNFSHNIDPLDFVQEALIMKNFEHPNVMRLVGLAEKEPGVPYVILPFMDKGDLLTYIRDLTVTLALHDVIKFGIDIASGMAYLSSLKLVHRDLAARNCMLDSSNRVKVADFGLCRDIYETGYYKSDNKKKLPIRWMALESIEHGAYSTKSDVWSFGVVLWELLTRGLTPYTGVDGWDVVTFLRRRRLPPPFFCPESLYNLMMVSWANDPDERPTFGTIKSELLLLLGQSPSDFSLTGQNPETNREQKNVSKKCSRLSIISSIPRPRVARNVLITVPESFSDREISRMAIELYEKLVHNYEPPRKFTNPFLSLSRKLSKRSAEKWKQEIKRKYRIKSRKELHEEDSSEYIEEPMIKDEGMDHMMSPRSSGRWSTTSDDQKSSFGLYAPVRSGDSLESLFNTTTAGTSFSNENDVSSEWADMPLPRPHRQLSSEASQQ